MKIYISADIEGVCGMAHWDEATESHAECAQFQSRLTDEVLAACEGAREAGATEIYLKDAHGTGRNIKAEKLPEYVRLIRGWSGHPFCMVQELDASFAALVFIGYHAKASSSDNPLAHTMSSSRIFHIKINGEAISEFVLNSYAAGLVHVPVAFLSGDQGLCDEVQKFNNLIHVVSTMRGVGDSVIAQHPLSIRAAIKSGVARALSRPLDGCQVKMPPSFQVEICFKNFQSAYRASFYPGVTTLDPRTIKFVTNNYFDVLTMMGFVIK